MSRNVHRGVPYTVVRVRDDYWVWEIHPPEAVQGWAKAGGSAVGTASDAARAATREIERQALKQLN